MLSVTSSGERFAGSRSTCIFQRTALFQFFRAKIFLFTLAFTFSLTFLFAQQGEWTWINGDSAANSSGVFGTMGIAAPSNEPPGLYEVARWTDSEGNFWLLGGWQSPGSYATPLWKYDLSNGYWTWMKGPVNTDIGGVYGTMGVPSASNYPGSRCGGVPSWVDSAGNLWLFGGLGYDALGINGTLSDMWMYSPVTNEWTWMGGSQFTGSLPAYGSFQTFSSSVNPGPRGESTCAWQDNSGNFWLYGGLDNSGNSSAMWQFDPLINQWAWMWGGASFYSPSYGTQGVSSATNSPGSRYVYAHWKDSQGRLWLSGGLTFGYYSDEWMYDPAVNEWTWMAGTSIINLTSYHGTKCDTSGLYFPASRFENSSCWTDHEGNFWLFGGCENTTTVTAFNDLWVFNPLTLKWIWINGDTVSQQPGYYGLQGIADPANKPASRFGAASWTDCESNLWLFGGLESPPLGGYNFFNDLWKFQIDPACVPGYQVASCNQSPVNFSASNQIICEKFCTDFFDSSLNNPTSWLWLFPGGSPSSSTEQNPANICYQDPGVFDVTLITVNANGNDTLTLYNYISVYAPPPFPTITQAGYTLTSSPAASYQWQLNAVDIPGATNQSYTILQSGYYTVIVGDSNGCKNSLTEYVLISGINDVVPGANLSIYPNPSRGNFTVELSNCAVSQSIALRVENTLGQEIFSSEPPLTGTGIRRAEVNLNNIPPGLYFIRISLTNVDACSGFTGVRKKIVIAD